MGVSSCSEWSPAIVDVLNNMSISDPSAQNDMHPTQGIWACATSSLGQASCWGHGLHKACLEYALAMVTVSELCGYYGQAVLPKWLLKRMHVRQH